MLKNLMSKCDISYDGVPSSAALNFNSSFGKISTGEHFKVLFTIQNSSASYNLDELEIRSTVVRIQKNAPPNAQAPKESVLTEKTIAHLGPKE